ncbi:BARP protein [Trypanosoma brucei brucei TREU927]|uniref:BARP protein n=1 Tax=Trypanosoma brucei brucei (strain 927/4 GUTat10.1) TaxID=185431 RepID=Q38CW0_TRYB2|nr:bloodstream stage alanine-rich protein BARP [Trypanosoma brucei brucei TREU927]EAN77360.1 BARP protein [Trypanosoma brucei brucei TREU927]
MSITFHNLWLLLTVLCTAGVRAHHGWTNCYPAGNSPPVEEIRASCEVAHQLRGLSQTVTSAVETSAAASSKAFEAKVQAEEAVELAESKGLNVTKAKEAAVRATLAAEAAATAASNVEINAANIAAVPWLERRQNTGWEVLTKCINLDDDIKKMASKCKSAAEVVTAESISAALNDLGKTFINEKTREALRKESVEFHKELASLEEHVEEAVRAQKRAEDAAADANQTAGTNTGPVVNSVASPEGSVLLLMAGLFLGSVL